MNIDYTRDLIKGKITEVIFEEMFRNSEEFTIIPLGYEHTTPILAQYQHHIHLQKVIKNIRHAPDFALLSQDKTKAFLVEVKYMAEFTKEEVLKIANDTLREWDPSYLFIASKDNFYYDPCHTIVNRNGKINELTESWIKKDLQETYLSLLQAFIK